MLKKQTLFDKTSYIQTHFSCCSFRTQRSFSRRTIRQYDWKKNLWQLILQLILQENVEPANEKFTKNNHHFIFICYQISENRKGFHRLFIEEVFDVKCQTTASTRCSLFQYRDGKSSLFVQQVWCEKPDVKKYILLVKKTFIKRHSSAAKVMNEIHCGKSLSCHVSYS